MEYERQDRSTGTDDERGAPRALRALLEMAGVAIAWAVLLFAIAVVVLQLLSVVYASQIDTVLRVFGMSVG